MGDDRERYGPGWWVAAAVGAVLIGWAIWGALRELGGIGESFASWATWLVGGLLIHDLIVVSVVTVAGLLIAKWCSGVFKEVLCWTLWLMALIGLVFLPVIGGYGGRADNPSINPLDYRRNIWIVLAVIAGIGVGRYLFAVVHTKLSPDRSASLEIDD